MAASRTCCDVSPSARKTKPLRTLRKRANSEACLPTLGSGWLITELEWRAGVASAVSLVNVSAWTAERHPMQYAIVKDLNTRNE